jgi:hypothetical protein
VAYGTGRINPLFGQPGEPLLVTQWCPVLDQAEAFAAASASALADHRRERADAAAQAQAAAEKAGWASAQERDAQLLKLVRHFGGQPPTQ